MPEIGEGSPTRQLPVSIHNCRRAGLSLGDVMNIAVWRQKVHLPFVLGPLFAMDTTPRLLCLRLA